MNSKQPEKSSIEKSSTKTFNLTEDERTNIEARQTIIKQYQYLIHVINEDIVQYTNFTVCPRVGLKEGQAYKLSPDNKTITVDDKGEEDDKAPAK